MTAAAPWPAALNDTSRQQTKDILSIMFAAVAPIGVVGGIWNRTALKKGIGTQFIRFIALVVALPFAAVFVFQGMLTQAAVTLILGILGYVFAAFKTGG